MEYLEMMPNHEVKVTEATESDVQQAITLAYQTGWVVQQIIYLQKSDEVMILFKRSDC